MVEGWMMILFALLLLIFPVTIQCSVSLSQIKYKKIIIICNPNYITLQKGTLKNVSVFFNPEYGQMNATINNSKLNLYANLQDEQKTLIYNIQLFIKPDSAEKSLEYKLLLNVTTDICKYLNHQEFDPIVGLFYEMLIASKDNKVIKHCPIKVIIPI